MSKLNSSRNACRAKNHLVSGAYGQKIVEKSAQETIDQLEHRVFNVFERTVDDALEICGEGRNKTFMRGALRSA